MATARFKWLAPRFPHAFGYTEAELLDQPFITFIHLADRAATSTALEKLSQGEPTLGLDRQIRNLRARLQNDWRRPRFIATIPGRGYRFLPTFTDGDTSQGPE